MRPLISESRFNRLLTRAAVLPLLLMAVLSSLLIWQIVNLLHVFEWVGHTDEVIAQANSTQKLLLDMETGKRGYLLTGNSDYLQPYRDAHSKVIPHLDELHADLSGDEPQEGRVDTVKALYSQWHSVSEDQIQTYKPGQIFRREYDGAGKKLMDQMRDQFSVLIGTEDQLRTKRALAVHRTAYGVIATALLAALLGGALLALSSRRQLQDLSSEYADAAATTRRQAKAIIESEMRLRLTIDTALDAVISADSNGVITDWNAQAETIFGRTRSEAIGQALDKTIIPEQYRDAHRQGLAHFLKTGEGPVLNARIEIAALRSDGTEFPVELAIVPVQSQATVSFSAFVRDITAQKQAETERSRLSNYNQLLLDSTGEGMYGIGMDGSCTFLNRAAGRILGITAEEALSQNMHRLTHHSRPDGSVYPADDCPIYRALKIGHSTRVEDDVFWRSDGTSFPVEYSSAPIVNEGELQGAVVTFADITQRKQAERELRNARDAAEASSRQNRSSSPI